MSTFGTRQATIPSWARVLGAGNTTDGTGLNNPVILTADSLHWGDGSEVTTTFSGANNWLMTSTARNSSGSGHNYTFEAGENSGTGGGGDFTATGGISSGIAPAAPGSIILTGGRQTNTTTVRDGGTILITGGITDSDSASSEGGSVTINGGQGVGTSSGGGRMTLSAGAAAQGGDGGTALFSAGISSTGGRGGQITLKGGTGASGDGNVIIGSTSPVGTEGLIQCHHQVDMYHDTFTLFFDNSPNFATFTAPTLTSPQTYTFPDATGTVALLPIDISSDTNLSATLPVLLTGDDLSIDISPLSDIGTPASDDVLIIEDITDGSIKKVQVTNLGGGGASDFLSLTDTPGSYSGQATFFPQVNALENALEFLDLFGSANTWTGVNTFIPFGTGVIGQNDLIVGETADYGLMKMGNSEWGVTSFNAANLDLDGAILIRNVGGPVTSQIEYAFVDSTPSIRFAIPTAGVGNATYNPRSMLIVGPDQFDSDAVTIGFWDTAGVFDQTKIPCDTAANGADLGVQHNVQIGNDLFIDNSLDVTGTSTFRDDCTFTDGTYPTVWDQSVNTWTHTLNPGNSAIVISGDEDSRPGSDPLYFNLDMDRTWTGSNVSSTIMKVNVDDTRTLNGGIASITTIFDFSYNMTGHTGHTTSELLAGMVVRFTGFPTYSQNNTVTMFGLGGNGTSTSTWSPQYNDASARVITLNGLLLQEVCNPQNSGAGTAKVDYRSIEINPAFSFFWPGSSGADLADIYATHYAPNFSNFGATVNVYGLYYEPNISNNIDAGAVSNSYGLYYDPTTSIVTGTYNSYVIWATEGDIVFDGDDSAIQFGDGQDVEIGPFDGTSFELVRVLQTTDEIVINETGENTDFRVEGDNDANLLFLDAGNDRVGIGTNTPAVELDVDGDVHVRSQGDVRFGDSDNSNYVAFQSAATVSSNVTWTLPDADGTADQVLSTNGSGVLDWADAGAGGGGDSWTVTMKTADQSIGTTVFEDDDDISFAVAANTDYAFRVVIFGQVEPNDSHILQFTGPASPNDIWYTVRTGQSAQSPVDETLAAAFSTSISITKTSETNQLWTIEGALRNGANSGTVQLQHKKLADIGSDNVVRAGSYLMVRPSGGASVTPNAVPIWAEESGNMSATTAGGLQYSYGNGDTAGQGPRQYTSGEIIAMALQVNTSADTTGEVEIAINGVAQGASYRLSTPGSANGGSTSTFGTPLTFSSGDRLSFITTTTPTSTTNGIVMTMWVNYD